MDKEAWEHEQLELVVLSGHGEEARSNEEACIGEEARSKAKKDGTRPISMEGGKHGGSHGVFANSVHNDSSENTEHRIHL